MSLKKRDHNRQVILDALPGTRKEVQERTGLSKTCVQRWVTHLHQERIIRISKWVKPTPTSQNTAFYRVGSAPDSVCKQEPLTNTQRATRWRTRLKERSPDRYELLMKKSLARIWTHKAKSGRHDPLMVALYGQPKGRKHEKTSQ